MAAGAETLLRIYRRMLQIRRVEEKIVDLYSEQQMRCPVHLSIGQEAVPSAVSEVLTRDDLVLSSHRSHGHYLAKGGNLRTMMAEIYGKAKGCSQGKGGSMHLVDLSCGFLGATPIVSSTIPIAVGVAWASVMKKENQVVAAYFGEGAIEEGVFHESINFAALKKLSVLFICENNFYSVYSPLSVRQPANREVFQIAIGHGIESWQGDGNDADEVYHRVQKAVAMLRAGKGPIFMEFKTYRWREHCGPNYDNDLGYRTEEEYSKWKERCPLKLLKEKLSKEYNIQESAFTALENGIQKEIEEAFAFAKSSPFPSPETLNEHVYAS